MAIDKKFIDQFINVTSRAAYASSFFIGKKDKIAADKAGQKALSLGLTSIEVEVSGPGSGRESAVRALNGCGLKVTKISDVTPIPHNGCRPPKKRRV